MLEGGCSCGEVRYRLTSEPLFVHCCHCLNCQRQTGSAFVINVLIEADRVELLDVRRAPLPAPDTPAPVRFLPKWDNVLLAWADRTRVLPEKYRTKVIRMNGDVAQTVLVDGFVAGTWRVENGRVVVEPFAPLSRASKREVEDEAGRLEAFLAKPS